jgi:hypothetical protein
MDSCQTASSINRPYGTPPHVFALCIVLMLILMSAACGVWSIEPGDGRPPRSGDECHGQGDCGPSPSLLFCRPPGVSLGCGSCIAIANPCTADSDCAADTICDVPWCGCGRKTCIPGCRSGSCPEGQTCGDNNRCAAIACTPGDNACSPDFACDSGHCARKTCKADADCSSACLDGTCYSAPGACTMPLS